LIRQLGSGVALPDDTVVIMDANGTSVRFEITNLFPDEFNNSAISLIAVHYHDGIGSSDCDKNFEPDIDATVSYTAVCYDGYTDVSVYVYFQGPDFDAEECEACQAPEDDDAGVTAFYFELPCDNPCEPPAPHANGDDCYSGAELRRTEGSCPSSVDMPIEILDMNGESVTFALSQTFSTTAQQSIAVRYSRSPYSDKDPDSGYCRKFYDVSSGLIAGDFKALCNADGVAEVSIYTDSDTASCEYNEGKNCGYHYVIPCKENSLCPSSGHRGLAESEFREREVYTSAGSVPPANEPSVHDEDIPYCVSEDFPCEGEGSDPVFVCHYSVRKGYQTFCIPETDSDMLRFYPDDYCGPCEGGYGGLLN
jgi:hypothetical protein